MTHTHESRARLFVPLIKNSPHCPPVAGEARWEQTVVDLDDRLPEDVTHAEPELHFF